MTISLEEIKKRTIELAQLERTEDGYLKGENSYNARGLYRVVLVENGVAYKIVKRAQDAISQNWTEWDFYYSASRELQSMMVKPLAISLCGLVIAMEYVPHTLFALYGKDAGQTGMVFNKKLLEALMRSGYDYWYAKDVISDNHADNIGQMKDGTMIWMDYAAPCVIQG